VGRAARSVLTCGDGVHRVWTRIRRSAEPVVRRFADGRRAARGRAVNSGGRADGVPTCSSRTRPCACAPAVGASG